MLKAIIGLIVGLIIGSAAPLIMMNNKIAAVLLVVSIDAVIGSFRAALELKFSDSEIMSSFIVNSLAAISLVYLGDYLIVNLYYLVIFALGIRIFNNLSKIRRYVIKKL